MSAAQCRSAVANKDAFIASRFSRMHHCEVFCGRRLSKARWPSGLRRQTKDLVRKGVGSNPTLVI